MGIGELVVDGSAGGFHLLVTLAHFVKPGDVSTVNEREPFFGSGDDPWLRSSRCFDPGQVDGKPEEYWVLLLGSDGIPSLLRHLARFVIVRPKRHPTPTLPCRNALSHRLRQPLQHESVFDLGCRHLGKLFGGRYQLRTEYA